MFSVAIDGPAGAGKSTLAKKLAKELGFIYVDTGALYRAIGFCVFSNAIVNDDDAVIRLLDSINIELAFQNGNQLVILNGLNITEKIRTPKISMLASKVSAIPEVRKFLLSLQKDIAKENDVVMDGRDIGTVILPNADVKIFLTASAEIRAKRRQLELENKGVMQSYNKILREIQKRDYDDSHRKEAPLKIADDAVILDTSELDEKQTLEKALSIVKEKYD